MDSSCRRKTPKDDSHKSDGKQQLGSYGHEETKICQNLFRRKQAVKQLGRNAQSKLICAGCEVTARLPGSAWETLIFRWVAFDE